MSEETKTDEQMAEEATRKFVEEHGLYGQMTARYRTAAEAFLAGYRAAIAELEKREREAFEAGRELLNHRHPSMGTYFLHGMAMQFADYDDYKKSKEG